MTSRSVVVIGHVDHGKTALVRALTGMDTDRLPEEKARGLSIALGFAHLLLPTGVIDLIDAPGHADFLRRMIAGASAADAALVVVSAAEGIGAQTREHLRIAQLLGIGPVIAAATKCDLAPDGASDDIADRLRDLWPGALSVVACSARTGAGIPDLRAALAGLLDVPPPACTAPGPVVMIDRSFSLPGRGTVVAGTLRGGALCTGDLAQILPRGRSVTIRALQSRGLPVEQAGAGQRIAINLRGASPEEAPVGSVLAAPGLLQATQLLDICLTGDGNAVALPRPGEDIRIALGTASVIGRWRPLTPGGEFGQLRLHAPQTAYAGQRAILLRLSPAQTLGAAIVVDPLARPVRAGAAARVAVLSAANAGLADALLNALVEQEQGAATQDDLTRLLRRGSFSPALPDGAVDLGSGMLGTVDSVARACARVMERLDDALVRNPIRCTIPRAELRLGRMPEPLWSFVCDRLQSQDKIKCFGDRLFPVGHDPEKYLSVREASRLAKIETALRRDGLTGRFAVAPKDKHLEALLVDLGRAVTLRNVALDRFVTLHVDAVAEAITDLRTAFPGPSGFRTGAARTRLGTSRRVIVPLLEHLDRQGITRREGDLRQWTDAPPVRAAV